MNFRLLSTILLVIISIFLRESSSTEVKEQKPRFQPPNIPENPYLALYINENDLDSKFILSKAKKEGVEDNISRYDGTWKIEVPSSSAIDGDYGLVMHDKAKHYAVATKLLRPLRFDTKDLVIQYEVKFQDGMACGGAYIKLLSKTLDDDLTKFYDKTPFTIMFGPDKCGTDSKIHFIFRHQNPVTKTFEEKSKQTPIKDEKIFTDHMTHVFTLVLHDTNKFEIYVDQNQVSSGSLLEDFTPPVNPPNEIPDPNDKKPADWDERPKIPDPSASKPVDWDENAPEFITDVSATKPEGWLDNEPQMIGDPSVKKPDDWDVDLDGEWEAPKIDNPACKSAPGCGEWKAPQIPNPAFKGKWSAPMIDNPAYKGEWKPKVIPNPDYFEDLHPYRMTEVYALGLELWSMSDGVVFDNFLITDSKQDADNWISQTWAVKHKAEIQANPNAQSVVDFMREQMEERPAIVLAIAITVIFFIAIVSYMLCCRSGPSDEMSSAARRKKDDDYNARDNDSDADLDKDQQYEAAGPVADAMKKQNSSKTSSSRSQSQSPSRRSEPQMNGHSSDDSIQDVDVQKSSSPAKETKLKRRSRKD